MADLHASVQAQLHAFKAAIDQANQHVMEVDALMNTLDHEFETFASHLQTETEQHLTLLHGLTAQCHSLDSELAHAFGDLSHAVSAAEQELGQEVAELEKEATNLQHENDGFVQRTEESDHSVEQIVQDTSHFADDTNAKVHEAAQHIIDTGHQTAEKFGNELVHHVTDLHQKIDQTYHGFEQEANNHLHELGQEVHSYASHVSEQAQHFADQAHNAGNAAKDKLMASVHELEHGVTGHLGDLGHDIQTFHDSFMKLSEFITTLSNEGVVAVEDLGLVMEATNVGLNGVVKTVTNVKEILDEIHL